MARVIVLFLFLAAGTPAFGMTAVCAEPQDDAGVYGNEGNREDGEPRDDAGGQGKVQEMFSWLEGQLIEGDLTAEQDIRAAIDAGEERFGIHLPDGAKDAVISVIAGCQSFGLKPGFLVDQAAAIYEEYGGDIAGDSGSSFFRVVWEAVKDLLFGLWDFLKDLWNWLFGNT